MTTCSNEIQIQCSVCKRMYAELAAIVAWMRFHPVRVPICIQCDPKAQPAIEMRLTPKGWGSASEKGG